MPRVRGRPSRKTNVPQDVRNIFDETGEWALSSFDHRHQFIVSGVYQLPFFRDSSGVAGAIGRGWRANAVFIAQSGAPFTVNLGVDRANIGAGPAQRPDQLQRSEPVRESANAGTLVRYRRIRAAGAVHLRQRPRNSVLGPGFANMDFALAKTWRVAGGSDLEFRWEVFNLFNRANFDLPNRIFGSPSFGRIFSAKNPREMQFGLRLSF